MAKPEDEAPETEAQPTAAAKGSSGSGAKAAPKTTEVASEEPSGEEEPQALPPTEQEQGDVTAFTPQWLIDNSEAVLGYPVQVTAGALLGSEEEFLTVEQAKGTIATWLETPVATDSGEEG